MKKKLTGIAGIIMNAPVAKVWEALTTPSIIEQYFFGTHAVSDWKQGSPLIFKGEWEGKAYVDKGTILEIIPQKLFRYDYWSSMSGVPDKPENYVIISYELTEKENGTYLLIRQENIPDKKTKEHSEQNWYIVLYALKDLLEKHLAKKEPMIFY
ncbi:MAG: SRPBCC family protein [Bacteroidota bacterium]